jgi:hypothetical protein
LEDGPNPAPATTSFSQQTSTPIAQAETSRVYYVSFHFVGPCRARGRTLELERRPVDAIRAAVRHGDLLALEQISDDNPFSGGRAPGSNPGIPTNL